MLRSEFLQGNDYKLRYLSPGTPFSPELKPVLFLHGFTGSSSDWRNIALNCSKNIYPVIPDLPGHGETATAEKYFTPEGQIQLINELLKAHGIDKVYITAYSMGGRLALLYASKHPEKIAGLMIENSTPGIKDLSEREERRKFDLKIIDKLKTNTPRQFLEFWLSIPLFSSLNANPEIDANSVIEDRLSFFDSDGLINSLKYFGTGVMPWCGNNNALLAEKPVYLVNGEFDIKYKNILSDLHKNIPNSEFFIVPNAGHNVHLENPGEFIKLFNRFLS